MKIISILSFLVLVMFSSGCINQGIVNNDLVNNGNVEKVEVFHFHGNQQCYSCITIGEYSEETVNTYFSNEIESGKLVFGHLNVDIPENVELANKYGATSSSLWIGVYDDEGFRAEQNVNVWYKISDKEDFIEYLKGVIEEKLIGK